MAYSKFGPNYDELNKFAGSLTYNSLCFISSLRPKGGPWHNASLNTLLTTTDRLLGPRYQSFATFQLLKIKSNKQIKLVFHVI